MRREPKLSHHYSNQIKRELNIVLNIPAKFTNSIIMTKIKSLYGLAV